MPSPVPPGVPRPGYSAPNFNPSLQRPPNSLAENMQNLQISRPTGPPQSMPNSLGSRPPPFAPSPFPHSAPSGVPVSAPTSLASGASLVPRPGPIGPPRAGPPMFGPPIATPQATPQMTGPPTANPQASAQMTGPPFAPPQASPLPNMVSGRPTTPPFSQPQFGSRPLPGVLPSSVSAPFTSAQSVTNNGPVFIPGGLPTSPHFPSVGNTQNPPVRPPPSFLRGPQTQGLRPFPGSPVASAPVVPPSQPPSLPPFSASIQGMPQAAASSYGSPMWQMQPPQGPPPMAPGTMQPPRTFGMVPPPPNQPVPVMPSGMGLHRGTGGLSMARPRSPISGALVAGPSKIDPNQIPHPIQTSSVIFFETRQNNQANTPPPAASDYVVKDTGNCSPRYMRCTINQIPCSGDLLTTSGMPLALMVQPLALPHPSEDPIQVVDFGGSGPVRCSRCKGYINPFMKFIDQGRQFICNFCGFTDETPRDYHCNLGPDGRRRDADERPELCRGTVEFVATKEYMVRQPMPAVFFFLVDVSLNAVQTGATAVACSAICQAITDLPEGPRTMVGIATFDSTIHFYNLKRALQQPLMLIVPDVQDVYTPLETNLIVQLCECRKHLEQLLESIPSMFQNNRVAESAFGAAIKAAFLAMKSTGGKLLVFQSVLPSVGFGALSSREAEGRTSISVGEKEAHKLLQPADKTLKTMSIEFAEYQVCVDVFITTQTYIDIASISVVPKTTGGQIYYYYPFSAISDSAKLYNDLRWNVTRPQGFEAVMRVRCSQGLQVQEYSGNFCRRIPTDVDLPGIDCDKTIMVTFKHDDKFQEGSECAFQCALLYTTVYGQRRIRVTTLSLPCTSVLSNLFRSADLDAQLMCFLKQAANKIPMSPLFQVREQMINLCINILHSYRKFCATVSSSGQLILPEALKLLPLYTLALVKSTGLRTDGRLDDRSYWISHVASLSATLAVPLVYPRMFAIHNLILKEAGESLIPPVIPLSSEHVTDDGVFLLESGHDALIYVGDSVNLDILQQIFGVRTVDEIPSQFVLRAFDNELSRKLNDLVNEIRKQRCSYLRLRLCKKGDPLGMLFFLQMVEDKTSAGISYVEFLVHIHRQIQTKME